MSETTAVLSLSGGRRVSLLPCAGGSPWTGTVKKWDDFMGHAYVRVGADRDAVEQLDNQHVWLSTEIAPRDAAGVTIFRGRARMVGADALRIDDVIRLADERRRHAVRATGCTVTLPPAGGPAVTVRAVDISRGGIRLPLERPRWTYDDPIELTLAMSGGVVVPVTASFQRVDHDPPTAVLVFDRSSEDVSAAIDRYALSQLPSPLSN